MSGRSASNRTLSIRDPSVAVTPVSPIIGLAGGEVHHGQADLLGDHLARRLRSGR